MFSRRKFPGESGRAGGPALPGCLLVAAISCWPAVASAAGSVAVGLRYEIEPSLRACPTEATFRAGAARRLGYDPFREGAEQQVVVRALSTERGLEGSVAWWDAGGRGTGEQSFISETRDCADLVQAMTFAVAVQIQLRADLGSTSAIAPPRAQPAPRVAAAEPPAPPPPVAAAPPPVAAAPPPPQVVARLEAAPQVEVAADDKASKRPRELSLFMGAGSGVGLSLAPETNLDVRFFAAVRYWFASVELGGEATMPSTGRLDDRSGFRYRSLAGTLALCGHLHWWSACGVGKLAQIRVEGFGVDQSFSPSGTQPWAGARLAFTHRLWNRLSASLSAEGLRSLAPWTVEINQTPAWHTPAWGLHFGLDLGATFD